ncbi:MULTISPECIES: hypothetical protein [Leptospirillum]|jgi:flagellar basal body-associated protein FliL|uniref:Uncharacterized protein n=3 Tax=Leptospirillum ferriphilum TaxID=178606 RepID=A0A059XX93_9BACT|nr:MULTISPECIES: hypothetical protein [Leptospirillum]EAY57847.1 MAG: hypothetical protein UBAL2_82410246 [Leptospirillum rubarum]EIJ76067.1 MAG: Hypothetical protein C75L2_00070041 [Leptospirillum sp. Group II 'C75']AFS52442.1 hypothetical protein LFML04_0197 [Leptospirillum ferriphilum ML-04]AIA29926.1 hypothetical protein Y981_01110 [Leptospirillum ferriphilum YSK]AKS22633.1 hypothetical protein ABH19_01010 [Leptospirillum sp. Group II 'CF-1']
MSDPGDYDPIDPDAQQKGKGIPLGWILLPIALVFLGMMGTTLWHLSHGDFVGFATSHGKQGASSPRK